MYHANDADGSGRIYYKGNKYYGIAQPANAEDLFKKFPSGVGIITTKKLSKYKNRTSEISLYDHELSKHLIENTWSHSTLEITSMRRKDPIQLKELSKDVHLHMVLCC